MDRRIRRTRQRLQEAIGKLIIQKSYDRITVQDILDQADVGRATFYDHFRNKAELLLSGFENLQGELESYRQQGSSQKADDYEVFWDLSVVLFKHAGGNLPIYRALLGRLGGQLVTQHLHAHISEHFRRSLRSRFPGWRDSGAAVDMVACYATSSLLALAAWWLEHDTPFTAEQMSDYFRQIAKPGIDAFLARLKGQAKRPAR